LVNGNKFILFNNQKTKKNMNKAELIDAIASKADLTKADAKKALDAFIGSVGETLKNGDRVALVGFGSFSVAEREERMGRNPQTGAEIKIPAKKVVKFKAGAELSDLVK
jgi:DNA-binding protein HU-beta